MKTSVTVRQTSSAGIRELAVPGRHRARVLAAGLLGTGLMLSFALPASAGGDPAAGRKLYEMRCLSCHGDAKTKGTLGPSLIGIIGRKAGTGPDGTISRPLSESRITWDEASLDTYLAAPSEKVHGTIMPVGVNNPQERQDLIAYIKSMR
jgi:cytochrome c2